MSSNPCGCDPEANHTCDTCKAKDAYQTCLNVVVNASDYLQAHPDHGLDIFDILARIITDIQVAGEL